MVSLRRVEPLPTNLPVLTVDGDERFGVIDDDVAAGLEPDLGAQSLVQLVLDADSSKIGVSLV